MAWPDFPPPAQLDAEDAGLSGTVVTAGASRDGWTVVPGVPVEYTNYDQYFGEYTLKAGYYFPDELAAWHAEQEPEVPDEPEAASPAAQRVADFLGQGENPELLALAGEHVLIITAMVRAYTRDGGFDGQTPNEELAAVITTATARLVANPEQLRYGVADVQMNEGFKGFTLAETFVLNRYRKRAR